MRGIRRDVLQCSAASVEQMILEDVAVGVRTRWFSVLCGVLLGNRASV